MKMKEEYYQKSKAGVTEKELLNYWTMNWTHLVVDSFPDVSLDISLRHEHDVILDQIPTKILGLAEKYLSNQKIFGSAVEKNQLLYY